MTPMSVEGMRGLARRLAERHLAAARPGASEIARLDGETAALIIQNAELRAGLLPREEAQRQIAVLRLWCRAREAACEAEITKLLAAGENPEGAAVTAARDRAIADTERRIAELRAWIDDHRLAAWADAVEKLAEIGSEARP